MLQFTDDERYLPPKESLRPDILLSAIRRIEPQDFNLDMSSSPTKSIQVYGLFILISKLSLIIAL